jgi:hypothetical protein
MGKKHAFLLEPFLVGARDIVDELIVDGIGR